MDFDANNRAALEKRSGLPAANSFTLSEMGQLPPYFGWASATVDGATFRMFLGGHDDAVALRFFWSGAYERATMKAWVRLARRRGVAVDIGAHTGAFTLAAHAANPALHAIAFEPYYMNFARLNLNLRANGFPTKHAFMHAVGATAGIAQLNIPIPVDRLSSGGSLAQRPGLFSTPVNVVALDSFLPAKIRPKIGLVKIDTEGYEGQCIAGMREIIATARPVIFFECTTLESGQAVQRALGDLGYRFLEVNDELETIILVDAVRPHLHSSGEPIAGQLNRIAVPEGSFVADMIL